jgi:4-amino-4-deoxy-L-arabinose transferase-like glycosyltransferase
MSFHASPASKKSYLFIAILGVFLAILLPRIFELDKFVTIDEPEWIYQGGNFYYALGQRDFASTFRRNHPGVTAMWAGAVSFLIEFPEYRGLGQGYISTAKMGAYLEAHEIESIDLLETARVFIIVGTAFTLTIAFYYAWRLFGPLPAVTGVLFLAFDPFHIALTRVLHHDGTMSNMTFLAMLAFLSYFYRGRKPIDLIISAGAAGISVLAKVYGLFNFLFAGLVILIIYWQNHFSKGERSFSLFSKRYLLPGLIWGVLGFGAMVLFWPALWVDPLNTLDNLLAGAFKYATAANPAYFMGSSIREASWLTKYPHFYPVHFAWKSTPLVLIGLFLLILASIKKVGIIRQKEHRQIIQHLAIFAILFTISISLSTFKAARYQLAVYPPLDLLAGLGWVGIMTWIYRRYNHIWKHLYTGILVAVLVLIQAIGTLQHYPYYFTYMNPLLGGVDKGVEVVSVGWGEGLDQVGAYLETQPNPEDLSVMSVNAYGPLSFYFSGTTIQMPEGELTPEFLSNFDYVVIYILQWQYQYQKPLLDAVEQLEPEHTITLNGLEYARIYNVMDISEMEWASLLPAQE